MVAHRHWWCETLSFRVVCTTFSWYFMIYNTMDRWAGHRAMCRSYKNVSNCVASYLKNFMNSGMRKQSITCMYASYTCFCSVFFCTHSFGDQPVESRFCFVSILLDSVWSKSWVNLIVMHMYTNGMTAFCFSALLFWCIIQNWASCGSSIRYLGFHINKIIGKYFWFDNTPPPPPKRTTTITVSSVKWFSLCLTTLNWPKHLNIVASFCIF